VPRFRFICKSSTERPGPVWDAAFFPVHGAPENNKQFAGTAGGQIQLVGLSSDAFKVGGTYLIDVIEGD